ncbi:hypothetical protein ACYJ1Y_03300 [Natrialbaceae archaeon A-gly3]
MDDRWNEIVAALESSDSDRVNDVLEDVKSMDRDERVRLFDVGFEELTELYAESEDGYVRQSAVRVTEQLVPGAVTELLVADDPEMADHLSRQVDAICGFVLETIEDEDGRVRNSTKRALKDVYRSYDGLGDDETIESLVAELESMAEDAPDDRRKHLLETKEDAEFFLQPAGTRLLSGLERIRERSRDR